MLPLLSFCIKTINNLFKHVTDTNLMRKQLLIWILVLNPENNEATLYDDTVICSNHYQ